MFLPRFSKYKNLAPPPVQSRLSSVYSLPPSIIITFAFMMHTTITSPVCEPTADAFFGPTIGHECRGGFDFTILFEQSLIMIPALLLLVASPVRLSQLSKTPAVSYIGSGGRVLKWLKLVSIAGISILQLVTIALWALRSGPPLLDHVSIAAASVSFIASLATFIVSYMEHRRSPRPSVLLNSFLFISLLLDITILRSVWLSIFIETNLKAIYTASTAIRAIMLVLEAVERRSLLAGEYPPEATSGLYGRAMFIWVTPLLMTGFRRLLQSSDLYALDKDMDPALINERFWRQWNKSSSLDSRKEFHSLNKHRRPVEDERAPLAGSSQGSYNTITKPGSHGQPQTQPPSPEKVSNTRLILCCIGTLYPSMLKVVVPRLALLAFSLCQPLVLNRFLNFLADESQPVQYGYGLIAAYGLVYLGIALSSSLYWHRNARSVSMLRSLLVSAVYQKVTEIKVTAGDAAPVTLMSSDVSEPTKTLLFLSCHVSAVSIMRQKWENRGILPFFLYSDGFMSENSRRSRK